MKLDVISAEDLDRKEAIKREFKKEVLIKILNLLSKKISIAYSLGRKETIVEIPEMIFGYPSYKLSFVTMYMHKQLQNLGYTVSIMGRGMLFVSWRVNNVKNIEIRKHRTREKQTPVETDLDSLANLKKTANLLRNKYVSK
jgi:hypothetical protein